VARLYANESFPLPVVEELRRLGHDVLTVSDVGKAGTGTTDEAVLGFACTQRRGVLTLNRRHFVRLHGLNADHFAIVACTLDADFPALALRIHSAISTLGDLAGHLVRVNRPSS